MATEYYNYNVNHYNFTSFFQTLFACDKLEEIHKKGNEYSLFSAPGKDSDTEYHHKFYNYLRTTPDEFINLYKEFIKKEIAPLVNAKKTLIYQRWPSFRIHLPNNVAVGGWHCDGDYNHPKGEINFIVAVTPMFESNTTIAESEPGKKDFQQIVLNPGSFAKFNGNECVHGNLPNKTGVTRISFDFRVMLTENYDQNHNLLSLSKGNKFLLGHYYDKMELDE
jgi:hypothetical protein